MKHSETSELLENLDDMFPVTVSKLKIMKKLLGSTSTAFDFFFLFTLWKDAYYMDIFIRTFFHYIQIVIILFFVFPFRFSRMGVVAMWSRSLVTPLPHADPFTPHSAPQCILQRKE